MPSEYGVQWTGEAAAVFAIVSVVAAEFADRLADRTDKLAADPDLLDPVADSSGGRSVPYTFWWHAYAVTVVVRLSDRLGVMYVDRITIATGVGGINPYE